MHFVFDSESINYLRHFYIVFKLPCVSYGLKWKDDFKSIFISKFQYKILGLATNRYFVLDESYQSLKDNNMVKIDNNIYISLQDIVSKSILRTNYDKYKIVLDIEVEPIKKLIQIQNQSQIEKKYLDNECDISIIVDVEYIKYEYK